MVAARTVSTLDLRGQVALAIKPIVTALRGFAGFVLAQAMNNGTKLNLSVEACHGTNSAVALQGTAALDFLSFWTCHRAKLTRLAEPISPLASSAES